MEPTATVTAAPMRLIDYLSLIWKVPIILCRFASLFVIRCTWPRSKVYSLHWRQKLPLTLLAAVSRTLNIRQLNATIARRPLSGQQIAQYCAANGLGHGHVTVPQPRGAAFPPASLHVVTLEGADPEGPTVFYAHGGGYQSPMRAAGCVPMVTHMAKACSASEIVFLEYSLTPAVRYPGQLAQAVEGLRYLIDQGRSPSKLILGGDSAGGHLIASVLLHLQEPCPGIAPLELKDGQRLGAAVLLSPWLRMSEERAAARVNEAYDFLLSKHVDNFARLFDPTAGQVWGHIIEGEDAKTRWARAVGREQPAPPVVGKLLITAGSAELLFDSCDEFAREYVGAKTLSMDSKAKEADVKEMMRAESVLLAVGPNEVHVQPALDASQGYYDGGTMKAITYFLQEFE
ncbi:Alpha/beta hydrolase fold-3 [Cordyceps fumosorosea ARSEF 2679]|uniref:Alpha/beta hydrolase fold-3 n=1 Tax=Cordyceps fumosorosea (strain ARSEF 2679) TaxID=1081104 RepID=A0A162IFL9_CORFA|nr:Alpha/beta hydrolase fold-3 [Cordyceps fumosorosea ARSEF 2679]OAA56465.1 Alpha/beta hydrolase fold-3 [Cordyceps fumosorosea ARSEF 2679]